MLLRVVLLVVAFVGVVHGIERDNFINAVPVTRSGVQSWADLFGNIATGLPRFTLKGGPAPKVITSATVQYYVKGSVKSPTDADEYAQGIAIFFAAIVATGVVTLVIYILFCLLRFCCNTCGKRRRTKKYSPICVWIMRISMLAYIGVLVAVSFIGYNGTVGTSFAFDDARTYINTTGEHILQGGHILGEILDIGTEIFGDVSMLFDTVVDALPSTEEMDQHSQCLDDVFSIVDNGRVVRLDLQELDNVVRGLPDMSAVNKTLGQLDVSVKTLPDLEHLAQRISFLNNSIAAMPKLKPITDDLISLNQTLKSFNILGPVTTQIKGLRTTLGGFSTVPMTSKLKKFDQFWTNLPDIVRLKTDINIADGAAFRNITQTYNDLVQMRSAVNGIPSIDGFISDIRALNTTKNALNSSLSLIGSIRTLNQSLTSIPDLGRVLTSLRGFKKFLGTDFQLIQIKNAVVQSNRSIALQPSPLLLLSFMTRLKTSVIALKAVDFWKVIGDIRSFNASVGRIGCVGHVIDMISNINSSLVILPSSIHTVFDMWHDMQPQVANITSQQASLQKGVDAITSLNASLGTLPDFDDIIVKIKQMNASSHDMPNLSNVYNQLADLNKTLLDVPDMDSYINNTLKLNSSIHIDNLDSTVNSLESMKTQLKTMPDLNPHIDNMVKLNTTINSLKPPLDGVIQLLSAKPANAPNGYHTVSVALVSGLSELQNTNSTRPDNSPLLANLNSLNNTITTMPDLSGTITSLTNLNNSLSTFPDLNNLKKKIDGLDSSLKSQPNFDQLAAQLRSLNKTVAALPNLPNTQKQVLSVKDSADGANLNGTIKQLNQIADLDVDRSVTSQLTQLSQVHDVISPFPDVLSSMRDGLQSGRDAKSSFEYQIRNGTNTANDFITSGENFDAIRLSAGTVILLLPLIISLLGLFSVLCRCGCGSMCMSMIFMYLSLLYYLLAAVFLTPAVLITDVCSSAQTIMVGELSQFPDVFNKNLSNYTSDYLPEYLDTNLTRIAEYFITCSGPAPLFITGLADAVSDKMADQANVTGKINDFENSNNMHFVPRIHTFVDGVTDALLDIHPVLVEVQDFIKCESITPMLTQGQDLLCSSARNGLMVFGFSLLLLAILMTLGTCCGILGFKRLQRQNRVQDGGSEESGEGGELPLPPGAIPLMRPGVTAGATRAPNQK